MENPFYYYRVVRGDDFANREREIEELYHALKSKERVFLISPRRYGKTSLLLNLIDRFNRDGILTVYLDVTKATSFRSLLERFASETVRSIESSLEKLGRLVKGFFPRLRPKITLEEDGKPSLTLDIADELDLRKNAEEILDAPEILARKRKKLLIVFLDEFQEILNFNGLELEKLLRAVIQRHEHVGYVFAGSKRSLLVDMVSNADRPFYKMGKIFNLGKIPRPEFKRFLLDRFKRTGYKIKDELMDEILDLVEDYPYNAQYLCHELWNYKAEAKHITRQDVKFCLEKIIGSFSPVYSEILERLPLRQRNLLRAIALFGGRGIYSEEFRRRNRLGAASTVSMSVKLLMNKELLDIEDGEYHMPDVFLKEWIKRNLM